MDVEGRVLTVEVNGEGEGEGDVAVDVREAVTTASAVEEWS